VRVAASDLNGDVLVRHDEAANLALHDVPGLR
jgi:hypothetical protein